MKHKPGFLSAKPGFIHGAWELKAAQADSIELVNRGPPTPHSADKAYGDRNCF